MENINQRQDAVVAKPLLGQVPPICVGDRRVLPLFLEFVEGDTLADIIKKRGALPLDEALIIAKQICEALEAAHEKSIVHRDDKSIDQM